MLSSTRVRLSQPSGEVLALRDELERDVRILSEDIGPRGTFAAKRYRLAEEFILAAVRRAGFEPQRQSWTTHGVECANIEVTIPGGARATEVLIVGAHYDSIEGCPAANDNGSGVAGLLAVLRRLAGQKLDRTVRVVFFANEEPPYFHLGEMVSQLYARRCRQVNDDVRGMFCLETIGCYSRSPGTQRWPGKALSTLLPDTGDFVAFVGPTAARHFMRKCVRAFSAERAFSLLAAAVPPWLVREVEWSDHRGFLEVGFPGFMITDTALLRYDHYHRATDTAEKLDYLSMARVVQGVAGMIRRIASA